MTNYIWLIILTLSQAILIALKVIERFNGKKKEIDDPPCREHGEKIAALSARVEMIEKALERIEKKVNGIWKE
jgi:hypothetical protein